MTLEELLKARDDHEHHQNMLFKKLINHLTQWEKRHDELDYEIEQELRR